MIILKMIFFIFIFVTDTMSVKAVVGVNRFLPPESTEIANEGKH